MKGFETFSESFMIAKAGRPGPSRRVRVGCVCKGIERTDDVIYNSVQCDSASMS